MAGLKQALVGLVLAGWVGAAAAQSLPTPSRTMYKCTVNKVTAYSDKPCLGAERLTVTPTRGVNKLSGTERIGKDVRAEQHRELWADAFQPITGMTREEYEVYHRRFKLSTAAKQECRQLDPSLLQLEAMEKAADKTVDKAAKATVQRDLFILRQRFTELRC